MPLNLYATYPTSLLSIIGCSTVILLYHKFKSTINDEEFTHGYILAWFYLVLCIITLFSPLKDDDGFCVFQGIVIIICGLGGVLWTGYIAIYLYIKCYQGNLTYKTPFLKVSMIIFAICGLSASLPAGYKYLHQGALWCWIENTSGNPIAFIYALYYSFVWVVIIWNTYAFCLISRVVSNSNSSIEGIEIARRLKWYSIILLVFYIPQTVFRILQSASVPNGIPDGFTYFAGVWIRLLGLANSVAYGMIPGVKEKIKEYFRKEPAPITRDISNSNIQLVNDSRPRSSC